MVIALAVFADGEQMEESMRRGAMAFERSAKYEPKNKLGQS